MSSAASTSSLSLRKISEAIDGGAEDIRDDPGFKRGFAALQRNTEVILMAVERIGTIVQSLKNFARLDEAEFQEADLHDGLESTITLFQHQLQGRIELVREYGDLPGVYCRPSQINQVFMNVLANAAEAIAGEGTITISTRRDGASVHVVISDTGEGISPADLAHIFDPGFTTKGVGVGTGLGLAITYNIIDEHGGDAVVTSEVGEGTRFAVTLPIDPAAKGA